ncbi:MAG: hypothetical protein GY700_09315, partial [Propionibacteriaceae bacterium]|nr:hypothetical protein [Propionibacteriaceae bacterium]
KVRRYLPLSSVVRSYRNANPPSPPVDVPAYSDFTYVNTHNFDLLDRTSPGTYRPDAEMTYVTLYYSLPDDYSQIAFGLDLPVGVDLVNFGLLYRVVDPGFPGHIDLETYILAQEYDPGSNMRNYSVGHTVLINQVATGDVEEMDGQGVMEFYSQHQQLKQYLHLIKDEPKYPVMLDKHRRVMSLPPIINSDLTKITLDTKNVFIDVTATDHTKCHLVTNTLVAMFSVYCK